MIKAIKKGSRVEVAVEHLDYFTVAVKGDKGTVESVDTAFNTLYIDFDGKGSQRLKAKDVKLIEQELELGDIVEVNTDTPDYSVAFPKGTQGTVVDFIKGNNTVESVVEVLAEHKGEEVTQIIKVSDLDFIRKGEKKEVAGDPFTDMIKNLAKTVVEMADTKYTEGDRVTVKVNRETPHNPLALIAEIYSGESGRVSYIDESDGTVQVMLDDSKANNGLPIWLRVSDVVLEEAN